MAAYGDTLVIIGRPPTNNAWLRSSGKHNFKSLTHPIKDQAYWLAKATLPKGLERVEIIYHGLYRRGPYPDPGNLSLALKAAVDGVVAAGVIPDDTWKYITSITELPPVTDKEKAEALVIRVLPA